jgi:WD40 repeat protein
LTLGCEQNKIEIYDPLNGVLLRTLFASNSNSVFGIVSSLAVMKNGYLASGSNTIRIWNPNTGELIKEIVANSLGNMALNVLANGDLVSAFEQYDIKLLASKYGTLILAI